MSTPSIPWLSTGWNTIVVGLIMVTFGASGLFLGELDKPESGKWILEGLGLIFLRAGVSRDMTRLRGGSET